MEGISGPCVFKVFSRGPGAPTFLLHAQFSNLRSFTNRKVGCGALGFTAFWYVANSYIAYKMNDF